MKKQPPTTISLSTAMLKLSDELRRAFLKNGFPVKLSKAALTEFRLSGVNRSSIVRAGLVELAHHAGIKIKD